MKHFLSQNASTVKCRDIFTLTFFNPLPDMPIICFSSSAANGDMMSKIWTNVDTII